MTDHNLFRIFQALSFFSWKQRKDIVEETKLPRTTVYDSLLKLELQGILDIKKESRGKGRPRTYYKLVT